VIGHLGHSPGQNGRPVKRMGLPSTANEALKGLGPVFPTILDAWGNSNNFVFGSNHAEGCDVHEYWIGPPILVLHSPETHWTL
jgi:hypothetical protein